MTLMPQITLTKDDNTTTEIKEDKYEKSEESSRPNSNKDISEEDYKQVIFKISDALFPKTFLEAVSSFRLIEYYYRFTKKLHQIS